MRSEEHNGLEEAQKKNLEFLLPMHKFLATFGVLRFLLVAFKTLQLLLLKPCLV